VEADRKGERSQARRWKKQERHRQRDAHVDGGDEGKKRLRARREEKNKGRVFFSVPHGDVMELLG